MMINERRRAMPDRVEQGDERAVVAIFERQGRVEPPPQVFEHPHKVTRGPYLRQTAGKGAVKVGMGIDEAGHDHLA